MNIIKLLDLLDIEAVEKEETEILNSRREAFRKMGSFSKKLSLAALPTAVLGSLPKVAFGRTNDVLGVLNYALTLEHLEYRFYQTAIDASGLIPSEDRAVFEQIRKHEEAHVTFLQDTITQLGGTPVAEPTFDFTAGGTFPDPFDPANYAVFMALAQAFEDTGVRAYKGQAGALQDAASSSTMNTALTAALSIHGVEARHASQVRRMRAQKGWIVDDEAVSLGGEVVAATVPVYAGEDNVTQAGVDVTTLTPDFETSSVTEAYDEPLTMEAVAGEEGIAAAFIVS